MKKTLLALAALVLFSSHVMYLKLDSYFLAPNTEATILLFNGTFDKSENVIDRDRMLDVSLVGNGKRTKVEDSQWSEKDSVTILNFKTGAEGTWVAGVSTAPKSLEMTGEDFNQYLEHEGIEDMLKLRRENGTLDSTAIEKYSKHVKTIFQVGRKLSDDWRKPLGYLIEFVPLENPYDLNTGDSIAVKLLLNGRPLVNQLVYADFEVKPDGHSHDDSFDTGHSHEETTSEHTKEGDGHEGGEHGHSHGPDTADHSHGQEGGHTHTHDKGTIDHSHDDGPEHGHSHDGKTDGHSHDNTEIVEPHQHTTGQKLRTDDRGIVTARLTADGIWYLQTIHLVETGEEGLTHESNWSTLTFEVTHAHGEDTHTHEHGHEGGIPSWAYWVGSIFLVGILFFWFNRKK